MKKGDRAFTLIELLVVIAIIGLLATAVIASLNSARKKGRDARRISDISQLRQALEMYYDSNGQYPASLSALEPTYISKVPKDPLGNDYNYVQGTSGTTYVLYTTLEQDTHPALNSDVDTPQNVTMPSGASCADPVYCVQP